MTSVRWMTAVAAAVVVLFLAAALSLAVDRLPDSGEEQRQSTTDETEGAYRIVRNFQGHVAVFSPNEEEPEQVYDMMVALLPAPERERLEEGIPVADSRALKRLLEDYLS